MSVIIYREHKTRDSEESPRTSSKPRQLKRLKEIIRHVTLSEHSRQERCKRTSSGPSPASKRRHCAKRSWCHDLGISISKRETCTLNKTGDHADLLMWLRTRIEEKSFEVRKVPPLRDPLSWALYPKYSSGPTGQFICLAYTFHVSICWPLIPIASFCSYQLQTPSSSR